MPDWLHIGDTERYIAFSLKQTAVSSVGSLAPKNLLIIQPKHLLHDRKLSAINVSRRRVYKPFNSSNVAGLS